MNKAIIVSVDDNEPLYKIRIPERHKLRGTVGSTPDSMLPMASVCCLPGVMPHYKVGDVVWVDYENDEYGDPVILGSLYAKAGNNSDTVIQCSSIIAEDEAMLPEHTSIGNTTPSALKQVGSISQINSRIDEIASKVQ